MRQKTGEFLIVGSRVTLLALIVFAAANFGLTRQSGIDAFNAIGLANVGIWLVGCAVAARRPAIGWLPLTLCLAILAFGWLSAGLSLAEARMENTEIPDWLDNLFLNFAAYHADLAWAAMVRTTALLGGFLLAVDTFSSPRWGRALLATIGLTGFAMVGFVFLQKLSGKSLLLHAMDGRTVLAFGTYRYWGNAAAFLNLTWPVVAAIAVHTGLRGARGWSLWMTAAIVTFAGLYINTSKAGYLLGAIGLVLFGGFALASAFRLKKLSWSTISWRTLTIILIAAGLFVGALLYGIKWSRWEAMTSAGWDKNPRPAAYEHFVKIIPDAGWTGFGPGNFQRIYLRYVEDSPLVKRTPFWVAHEDYIQTLVEWGWAGTALWSLLLVPATFHLAMRSRTGPENRRSSQSAKTSGYEFDWRDKLRSAALALPTPEQPLAQAAGFTAVLLTALHSTVDFPMQIESTQFYFLLWVALGWRSQPRKERESSFSSRKEAFAEDI
jgi:hypothetical protein